MKVRIIFILMFILISFPSLFAQNTEMIGDTLELNVNGYKEGQIQWQFSNDSVKWSDIVGATNRNMKYKINEKSYFRAKITVGKCIYYTGVSPIKAFDFKVVDEKGDSIFSKTSEYIILIPDIQNYISFYNNNKYLQNMIDWIVKFNNTGFKIKIVLQLGDVTNGNSIPEWKVAKEIFGTLNNKIDYMLCTGNHDYGINGKCENRNTLISDFFNKSNLPKTIETMYPDNFENYFFKTKVFDQDIIVYSLEFGPRDKVINWADSVAKANPNSLCFLMTHAYLFKDQQRFNYSLFGNKQYLNPHEFGFSNIENVNDGEELWQKLIINNQNFKFVFCGHMTPDYVGKLISENNKGEKVLQMLYDTQDFQNGGDGWMQILEFKAKPYLVNVKAYSTITKAWGTKNVEQYIFEYK